MYARRTKPKGIRISKNEIDFAMKLRGKNQSYGEITKGIFEKFGNSWDISTIEHAIKRRKESERKWFRKISWLYI